jgi:hypothetical protein
MTSRSVRNCRSADQQINRVLSRTLPASVKTFGAKMKYSFKSSAAMHKKLLSILAASLLAGPMIANADVRTWDFTVVIDKDFGTTSLPVGTIFTGSVSVDDSGLPLGAPGTSQTGLVTDLSFTFGGISYDETTANTGYVEFNTDGTLSALSFGNQCTAGGCSAGGGSESWFLIIGSHRLGGESDPDDFDFSGNTASGVSVFGDMSFAERTVDSGQVVVSGDRLVAITGLQVGNDVYDVTFPGGSFDDIYTSGGVTPAFSGNEQEAQAAAAAMLQAINADGTFSNLPENIGTCSSAEFCIIAVPFNGPYPTGIPANPFAVDVQNTFIDGISPGSVFSQSLATNSTFGGEVTFAVFTPAIPQVPTVRMQLDATGTSFFGDFSIIFEDTGDGLLQHEEIVLFSGVSGTSPTTGQELDYSGIAYVPAIPGISTASGTINPNSACAQCWEFTPSQFDDVSDGWFNTRWTYGSSDLSALSRTMHFSYTFDGTDGFPRSAGAKLSGQIKGILQPDGDTVVIESFGTVVLTRPGLPDFTYASIEADEFNAWPNVGDVAVMSFSGLKNNFRSCPLGFIAPFNDCSFGTDPGGGFLMSFDPSIRLGSWVTAADGTGDATCVGGGAQNGCRVQDRPVNLDNWTLAFEVPADECTAVEGGCNPTGGHEIVLPEGFVVPPGGVITQTAIPVIDPRVDENGRCDGQTPLVLFDGDLIIPPHICGSPEFEVLKTDANFDILEGTILSTMFPEVFVDNALDCIRPITGDPQLQDIVVWQPTDSADVIEGHALDLTFDCGSSRGKTRRFSFYLVGMHIDFGVDFDQEPQAVTQGFIDLTSTKFQSLVTAVDNATTALGQGDSQRLSRIVFAAQMLYERGQFFASSRLLEVFLSQTERAMFDLSVGFNHEGNLLSRASNVKFTIDEKIIPYTN